MSDQLPACPACGGALSPIRRDDTRHILQAYVECLSAGCPFESARYETEEILQEMLDAMFTRQKAQAREVEGALCWVCGKPVSDGTGFSRVGKGRRHGLCIPPVGSATMASNEPQDEPTTDQLPADETPKCPICGEGDVLPYEDGLNTITCEKHGCPFHLNLYDEGQRRDVLATLLAEQKKQARELAEARAALSDLAYACEAIHTEGGAIPTLNGGLLRTAHRILTAPEDKPGDPRTDGEKQVWIDENSSSWEGTKPDEQTPLSADELLERMAAEQPCPTCGGRTEETGKPCLLCLNGVSPLAKPDEQPIDDEDTIKANRLPAIDDRYKPDEQSLSADEMRERLAKPDEPQGEHRACECSAARFEYETHYNDYEDGRTYFHRINCGHCGRSVTGIGPTPKEAEADARRIWNGFHKYAMPYKALKDLQEAQIEAAKLRDEVVELEKENNHSVNRLGERTKEVATQRERAVKAEKEQQLELMARISAERQACEYENELKDVKRRLGEIVALGSEGDD